MPIDGGRTAVCTDTSSFFKRKNEKGTTARAFDNNGNKLKWVLSLEQLLMHYLWVNSAKIGVPGSPCDFYIRVLILWLRCCTEDMAEFGESDDRH